VTLYFALCDTVLYNPALYCMTLYCIALLCATVNQYVSGYGDLDFLCSLVLQSTTPSMHALGQRFKPPDHGAKQRWLMYVRNPSLTEVCQKSRPHKGLSEIMRSPLPKTFWRLEQIWPKGNNDFLLIIVMIMLTLMWLFLLWFQQVLPSRKRFMSPSYFILTCVFCGASVTIRNDTAHINSCLTWEEVVLRCLFCTVWTVSCCTVKMTSYCTVLSVLNCTVLSWHSQ